VVGISAERCEGKGAMDADAGAGEEGRGEGKGRGDGGTIQCAPGAPT